MNILYLIQRHILLVTLISVVIVYFPSLFSLVFFLFLKSFLFHLKNVIHYVYSVMDLVTYKNVLPLFLNVAFCSVKPYGGTLEDGKFITMSLSS